jgi:endonuclease/exonuclease/phosphatase family metal-dependent hydrolase
MEVARVSVFIPTMRVFIPNDSGRSMGFRLLTYNIHKGIGGIDRRYELGRIIDTLQHYDPGFVFLQEVDDGVPRSRFDRQVDAIGDALGFEYRAFQANVKLSRGHYGNAILSRYPLSHTWDIDLTIPLKKRRRALIAKAHVAIDGHQRTVILSNLHLGLAGFERMMQLRRLMASNPLEHARRDTPLLLGGDLNDVWGTLWKKCLARHGFLCATGKSRTFPAIRPIRGLDGIYYRGGIGLESAFVGHTAVARRASDHLPLIADFSLAAKSENASGSSDRG